jgi:predicted metal-dependent phosphoesterase TrpH
MTMIIDLHVHTTRGSGDSSLLPEELVEEAQRIGLEGACLTEHSGPWDRFEFHRFTSHHNGVLLIPAMEVETTVGHITVFGLNSYVPGIRDPKGLRAVADEMDAYVVLAHPFRNLLQNIPNNIDNNLLFKGTGRRPQTAEDAADHPIFDLIDAIEVANGATTAAENALAVEVAQLLGKPMVGGSDAHSANGLGSCVTVFPKPITSVEEFMYALHMGDFYPATGLPGGRLKPIGKR